MARLGRRDFLKGAAVLAAAGAGGVALAWGSDPLRTEACEFLVPGLDPRHDGLRVAQLSDVHVGPQTPASLVRAAVEAANAFQPDLVVLTGDYLSRSRSDLGSLRDQLGGLAAPAVAVLGNHDHWVDAPGTVAALEGHGYAALRNQHTTLTLRGSAFTVVGIDDGVTGHADPAQALRGAPAGSRLLLTHTPSTVRLLARQGVAGLCLAGHTHGVEVKVPILSPLAAALLGSPYRRGLYRLGPLQLYVNRGLSGARLNIRPGSPPEVTLATLRAA